MLDKIIRYAFKFTWTSLAATVLFVLAFIVIWTSLAAHVL